MQDAQKAISKAEASKQLNADVNIIFRSPVIVQRVLSGDLFSSLLGRGFPGRVKRMVVDQLLMHREVVGFDGEIILIERFRAGRGTEVGAIGFSLLFRGEPTEPMFRHPG